MFIAIGMATFLLLLPLVLTSTNAAMRRLKRNRRLHRLVYPAAIRTVMHYFWLVKQDITQPMIYAFALGVLLGLRIWWRLGLPSTVKT